MQNQNNIMEIKENAVFIDFYCQAPGPGLDQPGL